MSIRPVTDLITSLSWERVPPAARERARLAFLDTLGAMLVGTLAPVAGITADMAAETWPGDAATILLTGRRASAVGAAFANGYAANGIDIDDCALYTKGHPGAQIVPTALALAEALGRSGAEMLTAVVVGYEVAHRMARIWHVTHEVYQACGSWGSVACAAVAAHLLRLAPSQTEHALGIAEYHAPNLPMMRDIDHPTMVKHGIGWGAMTGIMAAQLAARDFTGVPCSLGFPEYSDWVADVGRCYVMVDGIAWKGYACCAWAHATLRAAEGLVAAHPIRPEAIAHVRVELPRDGVRLGGRLPTTTEEAQFNVAWPLAALLVDGEVGPEQVLPHRLSDPRLQALVGKVELVETAELNDLYRRAQQGDPTGRYASVVTITLHDGQAFRSGMVEGEINYPQAGWDAERVEAKFSWLGGRVLDSERLAQVLSVGRKMDGVATVAALTGLLR